MDFHLYFHNFSHISYFIHFLEFLGLQFYESKQASRAGLLITVNYRPKNAKITNSRGRVRIPKNDQSEDLCETKIPDDLREHIFNQRFSGVKFGWCLAIKRALNDK